MTEFGGDLKISIDHGDQHVEFTSPGEEDEAEIATGGDAGNHRITDEFGAVDFTQLAKQAEHEAILGGGLPLTPHELDRYDYLDDMIHNRVPPERGGGKFFGPSQAREELSMKFAPLLQRRFAARRRNRLPIGASSHADRHSTETVFWWDAWSSSKRQTDEFGRPFSGKAGPLGGFSMTVNSFVFNGAKAAGHGAHTLVDAVDKSTGAITDAVELVPYVGKPFSTVLGVAGEPLKFAQAVASGERIDKAVLASVKRGIQSVKELAPYAQIVAASIPGLGTGVAAAIAGGLALAEGRSIDEAAIAACRAAIPGGPAAVAAFDAAVAAGRGESVENVMKSAAFSSLPPAERAQARAALEIATEVAKGKPVDEAILTAATTVLEEDGGVIAKGWIGKEGATGKVYDALVEELPEPVRDAMTSGVALGFADQTQTVIKLAVSDPSKVEDLVALGKDVVGKSEMLQQAARQVPDERAFEIGVGLMQYSKLPPKAITYLRDNLKKGREKVSFDAAISVIVGATTSKKIDGRSPAFRVGAYAMFGTQVVAPQQRSGIIQILKKNPETMVGIASSVRQIRRDRVWWRRFLGWIWDSL